MTDDTPRRPDSGYAETDFDRYYTDAAESRLLGEMFREHFDATAPPEVQGFCFVTMTGLQRIAALLSAAQDGGSILDVGCGRGGPGVWLSERLGRPLHGIDISRAAITQARERAARVGADATYSAGALDDTGLVDETYPVLVCLDALHFATDLGAAARELWRVTRPGGMLVATTWQTTDGPPRLRQDVAGALEDAGWAIRLVEDHPEWLAAQLALYAATLAEASWEDPAVQRVREEGVAIRSNIRGARRLLIQAIRSSTGAAS